MAQKPTTPKVTSVADRILALRRIGLLVRDVVGNQKEAAPEEVAQLVGQLERLTLEVQDEEISRTLAQTNIDTSPKLMGIAVRAAELAQELEQPLLPPGWTIEETLFQRRYTGAHGAAEVLVTKGSPDLQRLDIKVFGERIWSGYEGETAGYLPLSRAFEKAQQAAADSTSFFANKLRDLARELLEGNLSPDSAATKVAQIAERLRRQVFKTEHAAENPAGDPISLTAGESSPGAAALRETGGVAALASGGPALFRRLINMDSQLRRRGWVGPPLAVLYKDMDGVPISIDANIERSDPMESVVGITYRIYDTSSGVDLKAVPTILSELSDDVTLTATDMSAELERAAEVALRARKPTLDAPGPIERADLEP